MKLLIRCSGLEDGNSGLGFLVIGRPKTWAGEGGERGRWAVRRAGSRCLAQVRRGRGHSEGPGLAVVRHQVREVMA